MNDVKEGGPSRRRTRNNRAQNRQLVYRQYTPKVILMQIVDGMLMKILYFH